MDYDELVGKVIELLQREKRVPYRALKRRFDLDDDYIEDLKVELIKAKQLARDEDGEILVWRDASGVPPPALSSQELAAAPLAPDQEREPLSYTPKHLAEKILTSRSALEGERKQVTILFCDLANSTPIAERLGPEHMHTLLNRFFELALEVVHRYEGTINQFLGDGFMGLFGAPISHEDHARRSVLSALSLQRTLKEVELGKPYGVECTFRMGLNSGLVVVGSIGDNLRMDYSAVGDTTNLAARLQEHAAPGDILISENTSRLVQGSVRLETLAPVEVKGKTEPVPIHKVLGTLPRRSPIASHGERTLSAFVGRARELATLEEIFAQVERGHGQVVGIVAEVGGGKSRLLYEFRQRLQDEQVTYLEGRCLFYGQTIPYHPLIDVLRQNCGIIETDSPEAIVGKAHLALQEVGMAPEAFAPYLLQLLGVKEGTEPLAVFTPEAIRTRTFETLKQMSLNGSQRCPLIFEIEDLHWIDKTSETYLASLVESVPGAAMLLLTTYRPGYRPPWIDKSYATQLSLRSLTPQDSATVVHSTSQHTALPESLQQRIIEKAEGNPFFLEELIRAVIDHGEFQADIAQYQTRFRGVLSARIDRLPEAHKRLLQTASVLGREFSPRLLAAMWDGTGALEPTLLDLKRLEFLYERAGGEQPVYVFKHALTQEVAYDSVLIPRRQRLHAAAGHAMERLYPEWLAEHYEALAHHFRHGAVWKKAFDYLTRSGDKARQAYANQEAIALYTHGMEVRGRMTPPLDTEQLLSVYEGRGLVWFLLTKYDEAIADFELMRRMAQASGNQHKAGESLCHLAFTHQLKHTDEHIAVAEQYAWEALRLAQHLGDQGILARSLARLGSLDLVRGNLSAGKRKLEESLQISRREGYKDAQNLSSLSAHAYLQGNFQRALPLGQEGLTIARDVHDGLDYLALGQSERAFTYLEPTLDRVEREAFGAHRWRWTIKLCLGLAERAYVTGNYDHAFRYMEAGLQEAQRTSSQKYVALGWALRGKIAAKLGDSDTAGVELQRAFTLADQLQSPSLLYPIAYDLGYWYETTGKERDAAALYGTAKATIAQMATAVEDEQLRSTFLHSALVQEIHDRAARLGG